MTVAVLYYHSSVITIMGKSNRLRDATFAIYGGVNFL